MSSILTLTHTAISTSYDNSGFQTLLYDGDVHANLDVSQKDFTIADSRFSHTTCIVGSDWHVPS